MAKQFSPDAKGLKVQEGLVMGCQGSCPDEKTGTFYLWDIPKGRTGVVANPERPYRIRAALITGPDQIVTGSEPIDGSRNGR